MSNLKYSVDLDRINPEFIGISQTYAENKRSRLTAEEQKNKLRTNFKYVNKLNKTLSKTLFDREKELLTMERVRNRHNDDVR